MVMSLLVFSATIREARECTTTKMEMFTKEVGRRTVSMVEEY